LEYSAGDRGADLLAWFSFSGDNADAHPFYIAQCAAGDNWRGKQNDAGRTKWERKLHPLPPDIPFLFICRSHRSVNGTWNSIDEAESHIGLFDRLRMLVFLDEDEIKTCLITYKGLLAEAEVYTITDLIE